MLGAGYRVCQPCPFNSVDSWEDRQEVPTEKSLQPTGYRAY